jgi:hypothetical protein
MGVTIFKPNKSKLNLKSFYRNILPQESPNSQAETLDILLINCTYDTTPTILYESVEESRMLIDDNTILMLNVNTLGIDEETNQSASCQDFVVVRRIKNELKIVDSSRLTFYFTSNKLSVDIGVNREINSFEVKVTGNENKMKWVSYLTGVCITL